MYVRTNEETELSIRSYIQERTEFDEAIHYFNQIDELNKPMIDVLQQIENFYKMFRSLILQIKHSLLPISWLITMKNNKIHPRRAYQCGRGMFLLLLLIKFQRYL